MKRTTSASERARARSDTDAVNRQVAQYDKVLRENMDAILPSLIRKLLGINIVHMEELPDDLQHTKERKPDVLVKVRDGNEKAYILQIEWQATDEKEMVLRMAEYYIMLLRRYRLPVSQHVVYIGDGDPHMTDHLISDQMQFKYQLINFSAFDYHLFLNAENPKEKMMAILGNFGNSDHMQVIASIVQGVLASSQGELSKEQQLNQLRILANLRNLGDEIDITMESVAKWFKIENDPFYQRGQREGIKKGIEKGMEKGMEEKSYEVVKTLLLNTKHSIPEIANLVNVPEAFVRKVKRSLQA